MALIETAGLTKRYSAVTALDGLTLDVEPGIVGLVGPNGAGKSTLIKILLGLVDATSGSAEVLGLDAAREGLRVRERVGYMPEHDCLPPGPVGNQLRDPHGTHERHPARGTPASAPPRCCATSASSRSATGTSAGTRPA